MTIKDYLKGFFEKDSFTEENFATIFAKYDVDESSDENDVNEREKDLCLAELLLLLANKVSGGGSSSQNSESIERGDFKKSVSSGSSERSYSMTYLDRKYLRERAYYLFRKWGIEMEEDSECHYQIGVL